MAGADFNSVKLVKGGTIQGDDKAAGSLNIFPDQYTSFGGVADLWGLALDDTDINAADFGVVFSFTGTGHAINYTTHYIKATDFDFSIPAGATINGVVAEYEGHYSSENVYADHIRITVYYTEAPVGTNMNVNISDVFKDIESLKINISDVWKNVIKIQQNIGDVWKTVFG